MIVMELMGLGDLSKYLWENYRYEVINYATATHTHTHTHSVTRTHVHVILLCLNTDFRTVSTKFGIN